MTVDTAQRVLVLGANYGLLAAVKISLAGHRVTLVCRKAEAETFLVQGAHVRLPDRALTGHVDLAVPVMAGFATAAGRLGAIAPENVPLDAVDLVILAMGEPQFAAPEIATLIEDIGAAGVPCLSLMNLLPATYLAGLGVDVAALAPAYGAFDVWKTLSPDQLTAASPDPQAVRLDPARPNDLTVTLASNFKIAPFADARHQARIAQIARDVDHMPGPATAVRFVAQASQFVPLAKWPMLITGNCRCLRDGAPVSIAEAVHADLAESRSIYNWVADVVRMIGATELDLVPFDRYAAAAKSLSLPSSLARALFAKAVKVERADMLVQRVGQTYGQRLAALDAIVDRIDGVLAQNRG